jgi:hypothetical protein
MQMTRSKSSGFGDAEAGLQTGKAGRVVAACGDDIERRAGFARAPFTPSGPPTEWAGRRGSSEDDLPLRDCRAPDLGDGRGLNPSPDEREPASEKY